MYDIRWRPGIGDPTLAGWLTVLAYFVAAYLVLRACNAEGPGPRGRAGWSALWASLRYPPRPDASRRAILWLLIGSALLALGINKQLDLQSLLTDIGRVMAHEQGWYDQRRLVQLIFIFVVLTVGVMALIVLAWLARGHFADFRVPLLGMVALGVFVVVRATSFHSVDELIGASFGGLRVNWILELSGIGLVGYGAVRRLKQKKVPVWRG